MTSPYDLSTNLASDPASPVDGLLLSPLADPVRDPLSATDLDLYRQTRTDDPLTRPWPDCPLKSHVVMVNPHTGAETRGRCLLPSCYACAWPQALRIGSAIAMARPNRLITLTQVGPVWRAIQAAMAHFRKALTRKGLRLEYAWHVEPNPYSRGHHVHLWAYGASPSPSEIRASASAAGMGDVVDVRPVHLRENGGLPPFTYGMKACRPPHASVTGMWPEAERYLAANGGHLVHTTRNFWRDLSGARLGNMRTAIRLARQAQGRGTWVPVT